MIRMPPINFPPGVGHDRDMRTQGSPDEFDRDENANIGPSAPYVTNSGFLGGKYADGSRNQEFLEAGRQIDPSRTQPYNMEPNRVAS